MPICIYKIVLAISVAQAKIEFYKVLIKRFIICLYIYNFNYYLFIINYYYDKHIS